MDNPFKYAGIVTGPYFADRKQELSELFSEMRNLGRVFLVSPRRYGKTCLIFNLSNKLKKEGYLVVYLDLNAYPDLGSFSAGVTEKVSRTLESSTDKLAKLISALKYLRPRIEVGPDGSLAARVEMTAPMREALPALPEGLHYCDKLAKRKQSLFSNGSRRVSCTGLLRVDINLLIHL